MNTTPTSQEQTIDAILDSNLSFTECLKKYSNTAHNHVDNLVMSMQPFTNHDNYRKFLQAQYQFHQLIKPIHEAEDLNHKIEGLRQLSRIQQVIDDMSALNISPKNYLIESPTIEGASRLGWLYCVEGSNVGAAILFKEAGKINLDENQGAKHLAGHADGRLRHWRQFKEQLDKLTLTKEEQAQALQGAKEAFSYYTKVIKEVFA